MRGLALAVTALALAVPAAASADAPCTQAPSPAGEWPSYGQSLTNHRSQPAETTIGTANAGSLVKKWSYTAPGLVNTTPIVDGGCAFIASQAASTSKGTLAALDADTGAKIWSVDVTTGQNAFGGSVVGTPGLFEDLVILPFNKLGEPFVAAFDRSTGAERWRTTVDRQPDEGINASTVVYDGMVLMGFFGNADAATHEHGGFVILDAATGALLKKTFVIDDADWKAGYDGAGIWSTAAVDTATGFAYAGTSNPHSSQKEHERANSLVKIDLNRGSATFGEIVASYKGVYDTLVPEAQNQPACQTKPDVYYPPYHFSATCAAVDLDFGASPSLFSADGRTLLGDLQKAGVYHIVDTKDMSGVSKTPVGAPCFTCNAASPAFADGHAFVGAGPPGQMVSVDAAGGLPSWAAPIGGGLNFNPVSVANGVVWTGDSLGFLEAYDQATGQPLARRWMGDDVGIPITSASSMAQATSSGGVAIARNTLYVGTSNFVIAYRAPA